MKVLFKSWYPWPKLQYSMLHFNTVILASASLYCLYFVEKCWLCIMGTHETIKGSHCLPKFGSLSVYFISYLIYIYIYLQLVNVHVPILEATQCNRISWKGLVWLPPLLHSRNLRQHNVWYDVTSYWWCHYDTSERSCSTTMYYKTFSLELSSLSEPSYFTNMGDHIPWNVRKVSIMGGLKQCISPYWWYPVQYEMELEMVKRL